MKTKIQLRLVAPWCALWETVLTQFGSAELAASAASATAGHLKIGRRGRLEEVPKDSLFSKFPRRTRKCLDSILTSVGESLPAVILALARCASLWPFYADECLSAAGELARDLVSMVELVFLRDAVTLLCQVVPAGAAERYAYRCGRTATRQDPRRQADT